MTEIKRLSEAEAEIMDVIWNTEKGVTVNTVFDALGEGGWTYTTVATFLTRLEKKGYLKCGKNDGKNFYEPRMSRSDYRSMQTDEFVNEIYGGAVGNLSEYRTAGNFGLSALKNIGTNTAKNTAAGSAGVNVAEKSGAKTDSDGKIIGKSGNKNNSENTKKTTADSSETAASGAAKARSVKGADNGNTAENTAAGADNNTAANTALSEAGAANSKTTANTGKRYIDLILNIISVMYLLTVAALGGVWIFRRVKFNAVFRRCCKREDESRLEGVKLRVGVRSNAALYTVAASCSPFVFGVIRPKIVIPESGADDGALMHELVHIKHRDTFRLALINIAKAIHFFNPLMYIFAKETKRYMELACDEEVSSLLSGAERARYSAEIVRSAAGFAHGGVCLSENAENIKERIDSVMNGKIYKRSVRIVGAIVAAALIAV